ncbi:hypothetical protein QTP88_016518 [Uroleucon formosanum]
MPIPRWLSCTCCRKLHLKGVEQSQFSKSCHFLLETEYMGSASNNLKKSSGLATKYGENEEFSLQLRCMWSFAFLHSSDIPNAFDQLKDSLPYDTQNYFEQNYVHGKVRKKFINGIVSRYEPLFPPSFWSIHFNHENNIPRTQSKVEAWHKRWKVLVGGDHVGVYRIIEEMRKEQQHVVGKISS